MHFVLMTAGSIDGLEEHFREQDPSLRWLSKHNLPAGLPEAIKPLPLPQQSSR